MTAPSLRNSADFRRLFEEGRRARRDGLLVYMCPREAGHPARIGLAVKADRAVDRNLMKRRLRSAWRSFRPAAGVDVAVRADARARILAYQELEDHLHSALRDLGLESES